VGGVIGINPYHHLVDGTVTTQPEYSFWFVDVGWAVENYGTDPDYDVDIAPQDYRNGSDPQLDFALELMDRALENFTEDRPDMTSRPSLPLPRWAERPARACLKNGAAWPPFTPERPLGRSRGLCPVDPRSRHHCGVFSNTMRGLANHIDKAFRDRL